MIVALIGVLCGVVGLITALVGVSARQPSWRPELENGFDGITPPAGWGVESATHNLDEGYETVTITLDRWQW